MAVIQGTAYEIPDAQAEHVARLAVRVRDMRRTGVLSPEVLSKLRRYFKIKNIYHSNAIEGNTLNVGETRLVVEQGLTLTGRPLKDQAEAKNLAAALDFLEELAAAPDRSITEADVRQIHLLVLKGVDDKEAGQYRKVDVEIGGSKYRPPGPESVPGEMQTFGTWLRKASVPGQLFSSDQAILAATAAHTWFVTIHPFIDGNGRVARLLMNLFLMRYTFPIAVVAREDRIRYYDALETSQAADLGPFVDLISECIDESLEEYEAAASEQREAMEWAKSIGSKLDKKETTRASNQYEVWKSAMDLLRGTFRQIAELIDSAITVSDVYFKDFGGIELEKYLSLKRNVSAKQTWFFRLDFKSGTNAARYLFSFGTPSPSMKKDLDVTLFVSREDPPGSFQYVKTESSASSKDPDIVEIGYSQPAESFLTRTRKGQPREEKVDAIVRKFIQEVVERNFDG